MKSTKLQSDIKKYLDEVKMMQLATSRDSQPWICNVWFVADDDLNIYWISSSTRRHSTEIADNERVAAAMCVVQEPSQSGRGGIQLEGVAKELKKPLEIARALKLYAARGIFSVAQIRKFMSDVRTPHKFYRIKPERIVFFDPTEKDSAREYIVG